MNTILEHYKNLGVEFSLASSGKLKLNADKSVVTSELLNKIKASKSIILDALKNDAINLLNKDFQVNVKDRQEILTRMNLSESDIEGFFPLLPLQEGMLLQHALDEENDPNIPYFVIKVKGKKVLQDILDCFDYVVNRHASYRTAIIWREVDKPYQLVKKRVSIPVSYSIYNNEEDYQEKLAKLELREQNLDLENDVLIRISILENPDSEEYSLFIERHHIISDHVSIELTLHELLACYRDNHKDLPSVRQQYELALQLAEQDVDGSDFFDSLLEDFEEPTLLFDLAESNIKNTEFEEALWEFDSKLQASIRKEAQALGMSSAVVFHFAWAMVLGRFSDSKDIVFSTVLSGRVTNADYRSTVGMFLNSLPCRVKLNQRSLVTHLHDLNEQLLNLCAYEQTPLSKAINCLADKFSMPFNSIFNYRHSNEEQVIEELPFEHVVSKDDTTFPFGLSVNDASTAFSAELKYHKSIDGNVLLNSLEHALVYITDCLRSNLSTPFELPSLLPKAVENKIIASNHTHVDYSQHQNIHALFEQQAKRNPEKVAVVFQDTTMTYGELNEQSNQLAHCLKAEYNLQSNELVGLCVNRNVEMIIGLLGILKAGGAYVPLDPDYPQDRLDYMIEDSSVNIILSQSGCGGALKTYQGEVISLDKKSKYQSYSKKNIAQDEGENSSDSLSYVIYTSGSTGKPKGVILNHKGLVNLAHNQQQSFDISQESVVLHFASMSFDAATWEWVMALAHGASLVIAGQEIRKDGVQLLEFMKTKKITHATLPPALLSTMAYCDDLDLECLIVAGESCDVDTMKTWSQQYRFFNAYGPSEASVCVTIGELNSESDIHIGSCLSNVQAYILDKSQHISPLGCVGELYVGGDGLAKGYLNLPAMTAEKFITNPFHSSEHDSQYLYRTGDLVRYMPDGNISFVGRVDEQIKIRGFRIESGEIEAALGDVEGVDSACVMAQKFGGDKQLTGFIKASSLLCESGKQLLISNCKTVLQQKLPDYMVPNLMVVIDNWPLTPNGKVDKKTLAKHDFFIQSKEYLAPETNVESDLVDILSELLKIDRNKLSINESILNLGANSILSLRFSQQVSKKYKIESPLALIMEADNIKDLALELDLMLDTISVKHDDDECILEEW